MGKSNVISSEHDVQCYKLNKRRISGTMCRRMDNYPIVSSLLAVLGNYHIVLEKEWKIIGACIFLQAALTTFIAICLHSKNEFLESYHLTLMNLRHGIFCRILMGNATWPTQIISLNLN